MSVPEEKRRTLIYTREWLFKLLDRRYRPGWTEIRDTAARLLHHYPFTHDIENAFGGPDDPLPADRPDKPTPS
jgi:hypothetical protein